jgi:para-nitrobenzyl esterase
MAVACDDEGDPLTQVDAAPVSPSDAALPDGIPPDAGTGAPADSGWDGPNTDSGQIPGVPLTPDAGEEPPLPPPECEENASGADDCLACTHQGLLAGKTTGASCEYLGVPYAKPPVGPLRFAAPEPAPPWQGVREATAFGAACIQGMDLSGSDVKSEDCLFLNVWTPSATPAEPLPVMVFVHGGGYSGGATNTYGGRGLSESGPVVMVSMNYRLGALGFFAHPELDAERAGRPSGSDGIRDQQLALRWVRDNIASFHGDPNNVTLFGESAGGSSVCVHLVSPGSRNLVDRFIMESGVCTRGVANGIAAVPQARAYGLTRQMAQDLCPDAADAMDCLRQLPPEQVMSWTAGNGAGAGGEPGLSWAPVIEGSSGVLPDQPDALIARGAAHPGEVIVGTNKNEYGLFQLGGDIVWSRGDLVERIETRYGDQAQQVLALYAPDGTTDANQAYVALMTDVMFRCPARRLARAVAVQGTSTYLYSFEHGTAIHADELTPLLGWEHNAFSVLPPPAGLQQAMQAYWTNFARTGDPNGQELPTWPTYDVAGDRHMTLVDPPKPGSALQRDACDFWDAYLDADAP